MDVSSKKKQVPLNCPNRDDFLGKIQGLEGFCFFLAIWAMKKGPGCLGSIGAYMAYTSQSYREYNKPL